MARGNSDNIGTPIGLIVVTIIIIIIILATRLDDILKFVN